MLKWIAILHRKYWSYIIFCFNIKLLFNWRKWTHDYVRIPLHCICMYECETCLFNGQYHHHIDIPFQYTLNLNWNPFYWWSSLEMNFTKKDWQNITTNKFNTKYVCVLVVVFLLSWRWHASEFIFLLFLCYWRMEMGLGIFGFCKSPHLLVKF